MAESPPKRVTRARAAKTTEDADPITKTAKIKTASARIAAEPKAPAKLVKTTKRKTRADDIADTVPEVANIPSEAAAPTKTRGRPKKAAEEAEPEEEKVPAQRVRLRAVKSTTTVPDEPQATKAKGRAKKQAAIIEQEDAPAKAEEVQSQPVQKVTRGRPAGTSTKPTTASVLKTATLKKRVTFEENSQQDKENVPVPSKATKIVQAKATGIKAKPVRKAVATRGSTRGKKAAPAVEENPGDEAAKPLSPKKVIQVAKSNSIGSEDELCAVKTPSKKALNKSPLKPPMSISHEAPGIDFATAMAQASPPKNLLSSIMASPAKRPAPSPFKDALKATPRKVNLITALPQSVLGSKQSIMKSSLLQSPARRPVVNAQTMLQITQSPFKASLLQSPARRPVPQVKADATMALGEDITLSVSEPSPQRLFSSPLRATRTLNSPLKVHKMTAAEQACQMLFEVKTGEDEKMNKEGDDVQRSSTPTLENNNPYNDFSPMMVDSPVLLSKENEKEEGSQNHAENESREAQIESHEIAVAILPSMLAHSIPIFGGSTFRDNREDSDSEDELVSAENTAMTSPLRGQKILSHNFGAFVTPTPAASCRTPKSIFGHEQLVQSRDVEAAPATNTSMTPLAAQLSSWQASSPDKRQTKIAAHDIFTPSSPDVLTKADEPSEPLVLSSPPNPTFFEDEMIMRDQEGGSTTEEEEIIIKDPVKDFNSSQESDEYGDENAIPVDPRLLAHLSTIEATGITVTPARVFQANPREIHTVSKVPLRAAAEDSPIQTQRKRSRSVSGPLSEVTPVPRLGLGRSSSASSNRFQEVEAADEPSTPKVAKGKTVNFDASVLRNPSTPSHDALSAYGTPFRSARAGSDAQILRGAVIFVDVHTTEGADASGIFVELLTQMGARCVKQWNCNSRSSTVNPHDVSSSSPLDGNTNSSPSSKVGITHVVFKDGGKRTLQKVREAKGLVLCIGVGWVLDCERENQWLDESAYAIDTSTIPRGGHNRRKSMEPRMLANINGQLIPTPTSTSTTTTTTSKPDLQSPTKEFLAFSTPTTPGPASTSNTPNPTTALPPTTPQALIFNDDSNPSNWNSPTTPYFTDRGAQLLQATCPPKQTMRPLFPISGRIDDQPDEAVRKRLLLARRKSLQWAPRVGSPLGKEFGV